MKSNINIIVYVRYKIWGNFCKTRDTQLVRLRSEGGMRKTRHVLCGRSGLTRLRNGTRYFWRSTIIPHVVRAYVRLSPRCEKNPFPMNRQKTNLPRECQSFRLFTALLSGIIFANCRDPIRDFYKRARHKGGSLFLSRLANFPFRAYRVAMSIPCTALTQPYYRRRERDGDKSFALWDYTSKRLLALFRRKTEDIIIRRKSTVRIMTNNGTEQFSRCSCRCNKTTVVINQSEAQTICLPFKR